MPLLSFHRGVTEFHRAGEVCFRVHQKLVGKQDFKSSTVLFLPASPACSEHEGSKVPWQFLLTAQPELHPAPHNPPPSPAHQFTFLSITLLFWNLHFPLSSQKSVWILTHLCVHHSPHQEFKFLISCSFGFASNFPWLKLKQGWRVCGNKHNILPVHK